ncbi:MAG TPA: DEAD/DEAH box helicase family protein, partial [Rudaea sp.]
LSEIAKQIVSAFAPEMLNAETKRNGWSISQILGYTNETSTNIAAPQTTSVGEIADLLCRLDGASPDYQRVVVIDEVDRLKDSEVKSQLAELIKLLGDRGCRLTIVMTGVGDDVREVLGAHPSAHRQLAQIKLERLQFGDSVEIVSDALERFWLNPKSEPSRTIMFRIASIANGFPYYAHLLIEEFLYSLFRDKSANVVTLEHLRTAVEQAVTKAIEEVRKPYDMATRGRQVRYKWLAWAVADSWDLERSTSDVYRSYKSIAEFFGETVDEEKRIGPSLAAMKRPSFGELLKTGYRNRLHEYSENLVRGYARLCAAAEDLELNDLRNDTPQTITARGRVTRFFDVSRIGGPPAGYRR